MESQANRYMPPAPCLCVVCGKPLTIEQRTVGSICRRLSCMTILAVRSDAEAAQERSFNAMIAASMAVAAPDSDAAETRDVDVPEAS